MATAERLQTVTLEEHFTVPGVAPMGSPAQGHGPMAGYLEAMGKRLADLGPDRIAAMDADGIDRQVLSLAAGGLNSMETNRAQDLARHANRTLADAIAKYPDRFSGFAALAMQNPDKAAQELETCIHSYGFVGALLEGTVAGAFLDQPRFLPVFEAAQALDVPIYLHPAPPPPAVNQAYFSDLESPLNQLLATAAWGWHVETGLHCLRLIASGLFDRLPRLRMIVGHMGENLPFSIARADTVMRRAGLPLKRSIQEYFLEHFWITTSGYFSVPPLLCAREVMGADRILLSIDYPFSDLDNGHRLLQALNTHLPPGEIEKIAWKNAAALLRL